jgi:superfamily I DNA/RNA helicase
VSAPIRTWSPYQQAYFRWVKEGTGSAVVIAVAGAGKTTVLVEGSRHMAGSVATAMYNKSVAVEFQGRLAEAGIGNNAHRAGTFHSFGNSALRRVYKDTKLDDKKSSILAQQLKVPEHLVPFSTKLVSLAKNAAVGLYNHAADESAWWAIVSHHDLDSDLENPERDAKEGIQYAIDLLAKSNQVAPDMIDFDDMIYLPVVMRNMRVWQNDWLQVDEAQDTNPARRALARKMLRPGGRAVFVGDPAQAIYGFTGADNDSLDQIRRDFGAVELPLTISYRCPRAVVREAQQLVKHIEASPLAAEGVVRSCQQADLLPTKTTEEEWLETEGVSHLIPIGTIKPPVEALGPADAILCRKTAPLVSLAFALIRAGTPCHVEGREIGAGLIALTKRWKGIRTATALRDKLAEYRERETAKLMAKGAETRAEALADRVECLLVLSEGCDTVQCIQDKVERLFADGAPTLTLSTVHKSKGREWERVFVLGRHQFMPSPWARQDWQQDQERNLIYVAVTRSKSALTYVTAKVEAK